MSDPAQQAASTQPDAGNQAEVDAVLAEFAGDHRAAIAALLHDLQALARDAEASTSWGYVRGKVVRLKVRSDAPQG
jgi:(p)ppGpp synthase/HD superfamily hydrolase